MHAFLIELLECPTCHGELSWTVIARDRDRIEAAEARCKHCGVVYPVRDGIGIFLTSDLPRDDLWEQVDSGLSQYLNGNPDIRRRLMDAPLETLAPADQFFRALALETQGDFAEAKRASDVAGPQMYTPEYRNCYHRQRDYIVERLSAATEPIFDLASGRCDLAVLIAQKVAQPLVASDFSLRVLRHNRGRLKFLNLYDRFSLLAFDARLTPFKNGAIPTMTTNLGLPNIADAGNVLRELRRVVNGQFLALSHFYPPDDEANGKVIRELNLAAGLYRESALADFAAAGWNVEVANQCVGRAAPTPQGVILEGMAIDGLPVAETNLEWCVLVAQ